MLKVSDSNRQIRYIQFETGTVCNYKCIHCPVAYEPRKGGLMPFEMVEKIVRELNHFPNVERIYLNGYDEPTLNPRLSSIVRMLAHLPARIMLLTNGTNLTPDLVDELIDTGANIEIDIHLGAVNRQDFERVHQSNMFDTVMKNIEHLKILKNIERIQVNISMVGRDNETDNRIFQEMRSHFADAPFNVRKKFLNDRAGLLDNEYNLDIYNETLRGCWLANRTQEWIHINATGKVILCPEDYHELYVLGDVKYQSLMEILASEVRCLYHQWTIGEVEAPPDYICRQCMFAISDETRRFATAQGVTYTFLR